MIAWLHTNPVHRRQMADRVALMRVDDELWLGCRARREIQQHRVAAVCGLAGRERRICVPGRIVSVPSCWCITDGNPRVGATHSVELGRIDRAGDDMTNMAAID